MDIWIRYAHKRTPQVTARLDRLPDATADDLARSDGVCIICREEMTAAGSNKKLGCGHVFHLHCLRCAGRVRVSNLLRPPAPCRPPSQHIQSSTSYGVRNNAW